MIKSLHIKNFRQHKELKFNFHPGLNIIAGDTGSGKSAALKALRFVTRNKPQGSSIYPKGKKNSLVEVDTRVAGAIVSRMKSSSINSYLLNDTELKSFRNDIPEQIQDILNLEDFNFQLQFDDHFLLNNSPGEVAFKLNEVTNLTIIDEYRKKTDKIIDTASSTYKNIEEQIKVKTKEVQELEKYKDELNDIDNLIGVIHLIESGEEDVQEISDFLAEIENIIFKINESSDVLKYEEQVTTLIAEFKRITDKEVSLNEIEALLFQFNYCESKIKDKQLITVQETNVEELLDQGINLDQRAIKIKNCTTLVYNIKELQSDIKRKQTVFERTLNEYEDLKTELKLCPVCDKPF